MKKFAFLLFSSALLLSGLSTVNAEDTIQKQASVTIESGTLDLTVDNNIDFGAVSLNGTSQQKVNEGLPVTINVTDALGDNGGWRVDLTISSLVNSSLEPLAGQQFSYLPGGLTSVGNGLTISSSSSGVSPGTAISLFSGDASALNGVLSLEPGSLELTVGASAKAETYTGTAVFSVTTAP